MHMPSEPIQPFAEMPIWARLEFMKMIPKTYAWDEEFERPRLASEAIVDGFVRKDNVVLIFFELPWDDDPELGLHHKYLWSVERNKGGSIF